MQEKFAAFKLKLQINLSIFFLLSNLNCILNFHATDLWCISSNYANVGACSIKSINGWKLKSDSFLNFCLETVAIKNRNWLARKVGNNKMDVFMRNFRVSLFWSMKHNFFRIRFYQNDGQEKKKTALERRMIYRHENAQNIRTASFFLRNLICYPSCKRIDWRMQNQILFIGFYLWPRFNQE